MEKIAIYGAGGFGRETACLIQIINKITPRWDIVGFFDDGKEIGYKTEYGCVLGGINELNLYNKPLAIVIAIGSPKDVSNIVSNISNPLVTFPNIIAPGTIFLDVNNVTMGKGNLICTGCAFSCNVHIGDFNAFNGFIQVGHDTQIGSFNSIMPAVKISGEVKIGDRNFFGVSSMVLQQIDIGNDTIIGANSLILKRTKSGLTYLGNPATVARYK